MPKTLLIFALLIIAAVASGSAALSRRSRAAELYFLDVGQGDSELAVLEGVRILTDAGPDRKILTALEKAVPGAKRLDLVVISHPQLDHFNGLRFVLEKYDVGAVILNGRNGGAGVGEWSDLLASIRRRSIPVLVLGAGDIIRIGRSRIDIIGPSAALRESGELNDTAIIERIITPDWSAVLTGDVGTADEERLAAYGRADILKVAHHGSRFSSGKQFLDAVKPEIAVIEVGQNRYGHPATSTLAKLSAAGAAVFRTDRDGTLFIRKVNGDLAVSSLGR